MRGTSRGFLRRLHGGAAAGPVVMAAVSMAALGGAVAGCSAAGPSALPAATCGSATTRGVNADTRVLSADKGALTCFATAARHCRAASLAVTDLGVDAGTRYVFALTPGGTGCPVTELSQSYSANPGGPTGSVTTAACHLAAVTSAGVTLRCAGGDVLIPGTVTLALIASSGPARG